MDGAQGENQGYPEPSTREKPKVLQLATRLKTDRCRGFVAARIDRGSG